jgi:uncharacterized protein
MFYTSPVGAADQGIEDTLRRFFVSTPSALCAAYLFGSQARGDARPDSDVDVAVLYTRTPPSTLEGAPFDLEAQLEAELGRPVQIVVLNRAPVDLIHRVLRDGKLVLERDRSARIQFEVRARNEYFDMQPLLAQYRRVPPEAV